MLIGRINTVSRAVSSWREAASVNKAGVPGRLCQSLEPIAGHSATIAAIARIHPSGRRPLAASHIAVRTPAQRNTYSENRAGSSSPVTLTPSSAAHGSGISLWPWA